MILGKLHLWAAGSKERQRAQVALTCMTDTTNSVDVEVPEHSRLGSNCFLKPCPVPLEVVTEEGIATLLMSLTLGPQTGPCRWDGEAARASSRRLQGSSGSLLM